MELREWLEKGQEAKNPELEAALKALILELASMGFFRGMSDQQRQVATDGLKLGFWAGVAVAMRRFAA